MFFYPAQVWQLLVEKCSRADVLQADRVQHSGGGLPQARRRVADHRLSGQSLDHEAAEFAEVNHILELDSVAECAAAGDHGILQFDAGKAHAEVGSVGSGHGLAFMA